MSRTFENKAHKLITTEDGKPCGVIAFHQHGDIIAIGASKVSPQILNTGKFKFKEDVGKNFANRRAKKAFQNFREGRKNSDSTMLILDLSKDKTITHLSEAIEKTKTLDIVEETTNRKQLVIYI